MKKDNQTGIYWISKKLKNGQSCVIFFARKDGLSLDFSVGLAVGKDRKQCFKWYMGETGYLEGKSSGKKTNPVEIKNFALAALDEFETFIKKTWGSGSIEICGADDRRFKLYQRVLLRERPDYEQVGKRMVKKIE